MFAAALTVFIVLAILIGILVWYFTSPKPTENVIIVPGSKSGIEEVTNNLLLPRSENQPEGIVFTYTGWLLINDFTVGYGKQRRIFSKGDCPGLYIDSTSNSLLVAVDTYGLKETILIPNIPAKKWIHFAITVNQYSVDIYINGTLRTHHTLGQLPKQNDEQIKIGGGWEGVIGQFSYYPRSMSMMEVDALSRQDPPSDLYTPPSPPQYFDMSWYIGRLNSI
jgi:hypothetical protein